MSAVCPTPRRSPNCAFCLVNVWIRVVPHRLRHQNARFFAQPLRYIVCPAVCMQFRYWCLCAALLLSSEAAHAATLTLAWDPNPEPNVAGYWIEYGNQPGV